MKTKSLVFALLFFISYHSKAQVSEIPNWDFQNWQQDTFALLHGWNIVGTNYERVAGHTGYALKLSKAALAELGLSDDTQRNGHNGPGFYGGIPFASRPDSVSFYANLDYPAGDSGTFSFYLHQGNVPVAFNVFTIGGTTSGAFTKFTFPVSYLSGLTPDSLVICLSAMNIKTNNTVPDGFIVFDDISFSGASPAVENYNFENWFSYPQYTLGDWNYLKHHLVDESSVGAPVWVNKTSFNQTGDYALEISNMILKGGNYYGGTVNNGLDMFEYDGYGFPVTHKYQTLNGYYKWFPVNGDTMKITIDVFAQGQVVAHSEFYQGDSVPNVTELTIPINYSNNLLVPDMVDITLSSYTTTPYNNFGKGPSRLIVDKLSFDGFATGTGDYQTTFDENGVRVYPNISGNVMKLEIAKEMSNESMIQLFNLSGQKQQEFKMPAGEEKIAFSVATLPTGLYFLHWLNGNQVVNRKIVVER